MGIVMKALMIAKKEFRVGYAISPTMTIADELFLLRGIVWQGDGGLSWWKDFELPFWLMFTTVIVVRIQVWWRLRKVRKTHVT